MQRKPCTRSIEITLCRKRVHSNEGRKNDRYTPESFPWTLFSVTFVAFALPLLAEKNRALKVGSGFGTVSCAEHGKNAPAECHRGGRNIRHLLPVVVSLPTELASAKRDNPLRYYEVSFSLFKWWCCCHGAGRCVSTTVLS